MLSIIKLRDEICNFTNYILGKFLFILYTLFCNEIWVVGGEKNKREKKN